VKTTAQADVGFPSIPGVTYTGLKTTRYLFDYGPNFDATGIPTINPPVITPPYEDKANARSTRVTYRKPTATATFGQYRSAVVNAVDALVKRRLMLCEDTQDQVTRLFDAGLAAGVPAPRGNEPKYPKIPHCN
jgi:hypothetical protein